MKIYTHKKQTIGIFSGRVEVAITGIDTLGKRMSGGGNRKTIRLEDTTIQEVYDIILNTLQKEAQ